MAYEPGDNWRNDPGLVPIVAYKQKFALFPRKCKDGTTVWLGHYYTKYTYWSFDYTGSPSISAIGIEKESLHRDVSEHLTKEEYTIRVLTGEATHTA